jgi:hypothetical protein
VLASRFLHGAAACALVFVASACTPEVRTFDSGSGGSDGEATSATASGSSSSSVGGGATTSVTASSSSSSSSGAGGGPAGFTPFAFNADAVDTPCAGERYVKYDTKYAKWVGVILCSPTKYKIFLADAQAMPFHQIGDFAGNGQDHCELVNTAFTLPNEDDITSGGCATCALGTMVNPVGTQGYSRAKLGEPFQDQPTWPMYNLYSVTWYTCGVSIP